MSAAALPQRPDPPPEDGRFRVGPLPESCAAKEDRGDPLPITLHCDGAAGWLDANSLDVAQLELYVAELEPRERGRCLMRAFSAPNISCRLRVIRQLVSAIGIGGAAAAIAMPAGAAQPVIFTPPGTPLLPTI